ncbi:MAG: 16S rRNA (cytosine(967)-C(5))-methyltransferase RsmB [Clostridia bacterium]|nr:16S rRNA (cytosine(967)-C(5))-methyltransferase RsmB [Clostridia bacterium]
MKIDEYYIAYKCIDAVIRKGAYVSIELNRYIGSIPSVRRPFATSLIYGVLDREIELEYIAKQFAKKLDKSMLGVVYIGIYMLKYMDIADYAAINASVELAKNIGKSMYTGFVNALLRNVSTALEQNAIKYPVDKLEYMSVVYSYPLWAVKKLYAQYHEKAESIISYQPSHKFTEIRVNTNVISVQKFTEKLNGIKAEYEKGKFSDTFRVNVAGLGGIKSENYFVQSASSVCVATAVNPKNGQAVLDCCAAPGGKSVCIAQMAPESAVTACDIHPHRVSLIKSYAKKGRCNNIKATESDATAYNKDLDNAFDCVLADVPCSGFGVVSEKPDIKRNRSEQTIEDLHKLQLEIVNNVAKYVKTGGTLVYSTCSLFYEENQSVIELFLKTNTDYVLQRIDLGTDSLNDAYVPIMDGDALQFLPYRDNLDGFFICKLKRIGQ